VLPPHGVWVIEARLEPEDESASVETVNIPL